MVQSINTKAIVTLASVLRRPSLLVPHVSVTNISEVNYTALQQYGGIEAVVFDKDNTITRPYDNTQIHPDARVGIQEAQRVFGYNNVAILSNSAGTTSDDPDYHDAIAIEQSLNIPVIRHDEKKPGGLQNVLQHFNINDPTVICMIGDRILTDIVFGNLYGMLTIHTLPFPEQCDNNESIDDDNGDEVTNNNSNNNNNNENNTNNNNDETITTIPSENNTKKKQREYKDNWTAKIIRPIENTLLYNNYYIGRTLRNQRLHHTHWGGPSVHTLTNTNIGTISDNNDGTRNTNTNTNTNTSTNEEEQEQQPAVSIKITTDVTTKDTTTEGELSKK